MMTSSLLAVLSAVLPSIVLATYGPAYYDVQVGVGNDTRYDPEVVYANPGDIVRFHFNPKNHTVTQSAFETPCVPLDYGVSSGFVFVAPDSNPRGRPFFDVEVVDYNPVWIHCEQTGHCGKGMTFAINPPDESSPKSFSAFKALAMATNGTAPPPPPSESCDHQIIVGPHGNFTYSPANITANVGDTVTFVFQPKNHTVTQSSFDKPCQPLGDTTGVEGFKSGFKPVAENATELPTFQITVEDDKPIWGYCGQANHCGMGMVFSINAKEGTDKSFEAFRALAMKTNGTGGYTGGGSGVGSSY